MSNEKKSSAIEDSSADSAALLTEASERWREAPVFDFRKGDESQSEVSPALTGVAERFVRYYSTSLGNTLLRQVEVSVAGGDPQNYGDFLKNLPDVCGVCLVRIKPVEAVAMIVFDVALVEMIVDGYFGGAGKPSAEPVEREFTPAEIRIIKLLLVDGLKDLSAAWQPVNSLEFEYLQIEQDPQAIENVEPGDEVVVSTFNVKLDAGGADFRIAMPVTQLGLPAGPGEAGADKERKTDDMAWADKLAYQVLQTRVELRCSFAEAAISLRRLGELQVGDFIPLTMDETVTSSVENIPLFAGRLGASNGAAAMRVTEWNHETEDGLRP